MPIYKNTKNGPLPVDTAEGNALSVRGKGKFKVSKATERTPRFLRLKSKGLVRFVSDDPEEKAQPAPPPKPQLVEEVAVSPESVPPVVPTSDAPGQVPTADESSASVAPADAQPSSEEDGSIDAEEASDAAEPKPGEGAADDDRKSSHKRYKRRGRRSSKSED